ncbi:phosphoribosylglycinamide formyltransferase [Rodentibacter caecimuris]|uniref:Phosphoribosylglycinamide formyltransferase n=1 Tax=Rodentibacter caecimuris TaxID=1796644 RepID=A0AAJ3K6E4_9PAST|nr:MULTISPECIES: phosphoribosylglycinamide formyltransferase [Pasteurellaceae]AOF52548.1 Phosphoribosylglycinamide formyltransferase [Pasteurellaceae bacterium NI1060]MCQ9123285.1 phosphoribosylglycinamide formyltransferase [Rodentibacter heylii]MCR1836975.1 phosphoribosylglycinamide formyltransferase [Pasteurella caecimuris]MCU0107041.1 phosphoribosylglycinamide formyltransferase [Pasteurella caecimuris]MCX2961029.1 phosphoribosylglycinamide formyltransferase [Rodentibacter heylii]
MKKIAVLISGQGSNLQAIIDACEKGFIPAKIACVVSNKIEAFGLVRAKSAVIPTSVFLRQDFINNQEMDRKIGDYLESFDVDLIVLAGYMKILTPEFTQRFQGKILNIHPSLLPKYAGLNTYQRALEAGDTEHGTTIHFVNEEMDGGAIILQAKVPIFPNDTVEDIELRTREQEYRIYPMVIKWFIEDRLSLKEGIAYLDGKPLPKQGYACE